ncbi:MAG: hypothetical protein Tsb0019_23210 [Roseibium sp.]
MQVKPVPAIPAPRIRRKPVAEYVRTPDSIAAGGLFGAVDHLPAHIAAAEFQRDLHAGARSEYAAQLLAGRQNGLVTDLDRRQHASQYAAASRETDAHAFTVSFSA